MSDPTLHHVDLKTTRLGEMIDWYDTVVGLKPQHVRLHRRYLEMRR